MPRVDDERSEEGDASLLFFHTLNDTSRAPPHYVRRRYGQTGFVLVWPLLLATLVVRNQLRFKPIW